MSIKTKCIQCGRTYTHYHDLCTVCRKVESDPFDHIDDGIDLDKEQDLIYDEIEEHDPLERKKQRKHVIHHKGGISLKNYPYPDSILRHIERNRMKNVVDVGGENDRKEGL